MVAIVRRRGDGARPRWRGGVVVVLAVAVLGVACGRAADEVSSVPTPPFTWTPGAVPPFTNVITIVLENRTFEEVFEGDGPARAPYLNSLADDWALLTQSYGVGHQSLTDYIGMTSGQPPNAKTRVNCLNYNCVYPATTVTIADQVEGIGRTWKGYVEGMPTPCLHGVERQPNPYLYWTPPGNTYSSLVNPWIYYGSIVRNPTRCAEHVVPFEQLDADLATGDLPDYALITPNLCNSSHDCDLPVADAWLATHVPRILANPEFRAGGLLLITFDEGPYQDTRSCCGGANGGRIGTVVISPPWGATNGYRSTTPYSLYSFLATAEDAWGLPRLAKAGEPTVLNLSELFDPALHQEQVPVGSSASVSGTVRDEHGAPLADMDVVLARVDTNLPVASVRAGADGAYRFARLAPGRYRVFAYDVSGRRALRYHGDVPAGPPATTVTAVARRETAGIDVTLRPSNELSGRIVTTDGSPVPAGLIVIVAQHDLPWIAGAAMVGADGTFIVRGLQAEDYKVAVFDPQMFRGGPYVPPVIHDGVEVLRDPQWFEHGTAVPVVDGAPTTSVTIAVTPIAVP